MRAVALLTAGCALTLLGVLCVPAVLLLGPSYRDRLIRRWAYAVVRGFGVRQRVTGQPVGRARPPAGELVVANHVSWLDIPLVAAALPARMVAKSEIRNWALLGPFAALGGNLFIERPGCGPSRSPCGPSPGRWPPAHGSRCSRTAAHSAAGATAAGSGPPPSRRRSTPAPPSARSASATDGDDERGGSRRVRRGRPRSPRRCGGWGRPRGSPPRSGSCRRCARTMNPADGRWRGRLSPPWPATARTCRRSPSTTAPAAGPPRPARPAPSPHGTSPRSPCAAPRPPRTAPRGPAHGS